MSNDGNMDHSLGMWSFLLSESGFAEDSFEQFVKWCGQSANCALQGQDVEDVYAELLAKADAGTLVDPSDGTLVDTWTRLDITQFCSTSPCLPTAPAAPPTIRHAFPRPPRPT